MTRKPKRPALPPLYADAVKLPPELPEAETLKDSGLPLTPDEFKFVRIAMAVHSTARKPQMTWRGWTMVGGALEIGEAHVRKLANGATTGKLYNLHMGRFLRSTGFGFLNKGVRWALRECLKNLDAVNAWRDVLSPSERSHLNNPIDVLNAYQEAEKTGTPGKPKLSKKTKREQVTLLDYLAVLEETVALYRDKIDELEATVRDLRGELPDNTRNEGDPRFRQQLRKLTEE